MIPISLATGMQRLTAWAQAEGRSLCPCRPVPLLSQRCTRVFSHKPAVGVQWLKAGWEAQLSHTSFSARAALSHIPLRQPLECVHVCAHVCTWRRLSGNWTEKLCVFEEWIPYVFRPDLRHQIQGLCTHFVNTNAHLHTHTLWYFLLVFKLSESLSWRIHILIKNKNLINLKTHFDRL